MKNLLKAWPNDRRDRRAGHEPPLAEDAARRLALFADIERSLSGWFWATDPAGCLSYISPAACERFSIPSQALIGQPFSSLFGTDPDNPGERSDRPLQFQIGAHARVNDVIVRLAPARCGVGARPGWWALSGTPKLDETGAFGGYRGTARDVTQDLYGIAEKQTEPAWSGCGFRGPWGSLKTCYRIPLAAQEELRELCVRFMGSLESEPPEQQLEFAVMTPCELRWVHCHTANLAVAALEEIDRIVTKTNADPVVYPDVVVLTADEQTGCEIGDLLSARGIHATDTFTRGERVASRRAKMAFHLSDARVKLTTIHSFKGMEARALIVVLPLRQAELGPKLLYTALSRLLATERGSFLTVVSMAAEYIEFGRTWPDYSEREPSDAEINSLLAAVFPVAAQPPGASP